MTRSCTCQHGRSQHLHGVRPGACTAPRCPCLWPPAPVARVALPQRTRAHVVTDADGLVVNFKRDKSERERLEEMLWRRIMDAGLPEPQRQYYWARPERMFRSDFAYPEARILLEVQGGIWAANPGRHNRGSGYEDDLRRSNIAVLLGYRLLAFSERMIKDGTAVQTIDKALAPALPDDYQPPLIGGYNGALPKTRSRDVSSVRLRGNEGVSASMQDNDTTRAGAWHDASA